MKLKQIMALVLIAVFMVLAVGCGQPKSINGTRYDTYGLFNESTHKNPNIRYEVSVGNVIVGIIFFETIIAPIYCFGFDLYNPIGPNDNTFVPGKI